MKEVTCQFEDFGQVPTSSCLDVHVADADAWSCCKQTPFKALELQEKEKK
jgi:hypothetical protein